MSPPQLKSLWWS